MAEDSEQPVPCVLLVSTRGEANSTTVSASSPWVLTRASGQLDSVKCPPLTSTVTPVAADRRLPCSTACCQSCAGCSPSSTASSGTLGVTMSTSGTRSRSACSAEGSSSRSPLVATMTGSSTTSGGRVASSQERTSLMTATSASMPTLTASMATSSLTASSCCRRNSTGGVWTCLLYTSDAADE